MANNEITTQERVGTLIEIQTTTAGVVRFMVIPPSGPSAGFVNLTNIFWVDKSTTVAPADQTGNIEAPFATLAQALALCTDPATNYEVWVVPDDYHLETLPVAPIGAQQIAIRSASRMAGFYVGNVLMPAWVTGSDTLLCEGLTWNTPMGGTNLKFIECELDAVTATNEIEATDSSFGGPLVAADVEMKGCTVNGLTTITGGASYEDCNLNYTETFAGGTGTHEVHYDTCKFFTSHDVDAGADTLNAIVRNCQFGTAATNFVAASGSLNIDASSYQQQRYAGAVTGMQVQLAGVGLKARVNVNVPAIVAAGVDYVDVSLVGTLLAGIPAGATIIANPTADLAAAGAGGGAFVNCWVNAPSQVRCTFVGIVTGGVVPFDFTSTGW